MRYLTNLFCTIWETETVPEEWHQGIIIPLYKGKGSRSDCRSYRGIDCLRRAVVLTGLFAIIGLFVVISVLCAFYCIFSIHAIHCISFSFLATVFK